MNHLHLVHPDYRNKYSIAFILIRNDKWGFFNLDHWDYNVSCNVPDAPFCALTDTAEIGEHLYTFDSDILPIEALKTAYPEYFI